MVHPVVILVELFADDMQQLGALSDHLAPRKRVSNGQNRPSGGQDGTFRVKTTPRADCTLGMESTNNPFIYHDPVNHS